MPFVSVETACYFGDMWGMVAPVNYIFLILSTIPLIELIWNFLEHGSCSIIRCPSYLSPRELGLLLKFQWRFQEDYVYSYFCSCCWFLTEALKLLIFMGTFRTKKVVCILLDISRLDCLKEQNKESCLQNSSS